MDIATGCSTRLDEKEAIHEAYSQLVDAIGTPSFIFVLSTITYDNSIILRELGLLSESCSMIGGTSCIGLMSDRGYCSEQQRALGLFGIKDESGCVGVSAMALTDNPSADGQEAIRKALLNANRPGELPTLILITSAPGHEEAIIDGIMMEVGRHVPIFGGTSADNSISGQWQQFCDKALYNNGVAVAAIYTAQPLGYAFHNGYIPTDFSGTVTKANDRIVNTIDNKPAAEIYNQWTGGALNEVIGTHANILPLSTFHPLGREVGRIVNIPYYNLSHPNEIFADGSIGFFSTIETNDTVVLMSGTKLNLKNRIKRVIHLAKEQLSQGGNIKPKGAFIIYCAGCFLAIQDEIQEVVDAVRTELPVEPFLGMFSFGEQGCLFGGENRHGNLMISVILFG